MKLVLTLFTIGLGIYILVGSTVDEMNGALDKTFHKVLTVVTIVLLSLMVTLLWG